MQNMLSLKELIRENEFLLLIARYAIEVALLYFLFRYRFKSKNRELVLSAQLQDKIIADFRPDPIVNTIICEDYHKDLPNGDDFIDLADYDFYSLANENKEEMISVLRKYGVGTCGPPGFYGTLDLHIELENKISRVLNTEASILYSNSFTCINSVITCFCKQYDTVFYHADCSEAIIRAISITRSSTISFENLDMLDEKLSILSSKNKRRFIITEGLFRNTGHIINMPKLIEIKKRHKARIILDETLSIPLLSLQGISKYFNTDVNDVDIIIGSLAHVFCGNGGFATGSKTAVDYQRLSAQSYCFSASLPGFLTMNALKNFDRTYGLINSIGFCDLFVAESYVIVSNVNSPMIVIRNIRANFMDTSEAEYEYKKLIMIRSRLFEEGIRVGVIYKPFPSIRICLKKVITGLKIKNIVDKVVKCLND